MIASSFRDLHRCSWRRLLREAARGVPFEEMGVVLPRPPEYAALFTDLLTRLGVPHRLHPSLPLPDFPSLISSHDPEQNITKKSYYSHP
jgi:hypothetical protein